MKARVANFYGWTDHYIENLSFNNFLEYFKAVSVIEAQKALLDIKVVSYPHLNKKKDRDGIIRSLKRAAFDSIDKGKGELKSYKDVVANIARKLNGR